MVQITSLNGNLIANIEFQACHPRRLGHVSNPEDG